MRYLSDIKILLGSVLHHKVHSCAEFFPFSAGISSSIVSLLLQHHYPTFFWSLIPRDTSTHLGFWWQKHQTMAFVQGSGTATLSPNSYILYLWDVHKAKTTCQADEREAKDVTVSLSSSGGQHVSQPAFTTHDLFNPDRQTLGQLRGGERTAVNHLTTIFLDTAAIIEFISFINHKSLTFIVEVMG